MNTFTIDNETNNITVHGTVQTAEAVANAERFGSEAGLAALVIGQTVGEQRCCIL
jgi:hypothetical protein